MIDWGQLLARRNKPANHSRSIGLHQLEFHLVQVRAIVTAYGRKRHVARALGEFRLERKRFPSRPIRGCRKGQRLGTLAAVNAGGAHARGRGRQATCITATVGVAHNNFVLARDFTPANEERLIDQAEEAGATLAFIDVGKAMAPYEKKLHTWAHFKIETYFRLLLPQLLPYHHKVLYLDSDMVCLADISELYDTDVEGYLIAACKDPDTTGIYQGVEVDLGQPDKRHYMDEVLKIENPFEYFQWRRSSPSPRPRSGSS